MGPKTRGTNLASYLILTWLSLRTTPQMHSTCATPLNRDKVGLMSTHHQHQALLQGHGSATTTPVGETLVSSGLSSSIEQFQFFFLCGLCEAS